MYLETIARPVPRIGEVASTFSEVHFANATVAFLFAASAPVAIILGVGSKGGLSESDLTSWIFAAFALNGILSIGMSLLYRMPMAFFWTIPGTVLVGPALGHLPFAEVIGAFYATGIVLLVLGLTGTVRRVMKYLPMPIIMSMVAGVFLKFGLDWIDAFKTDLWIALPMTLAFFILPLFPALERRLPAMIGVLLVGVATLALSGRAPSWSDALGSAAGLSGALAWPNVYVPSFSLRAMVELVIPLTITVVAAQNAQGVAILQSNGHQPPINSLTAACGAASLVTAVFGSVSTCLTGPSNAILCSRSERSGQYTAAIALAALAIVFGVFSPLFAKLMLATPPAFIATLAGLALLKVLQNAFKVSFQNRFTLGAVITFMVTIANHSIFNIGAPFWGLLFGFATSWMLERDDFSVENR